MCQRFLVVADNISIPMYIMCVYVCLSRRVGIFPNFIISIQRMRKLIR